MHILYGRVWGKSQQKQLQVPPQGWGGLGPSQSCHKCPPIVSSCSRNVLLNDSEVLKRHHHDLWQQFEGNILAPFCLHH